MSGKKPMKWKAAAVSDAHVDEAARLEAALSVSMSMAKSVVAGWINDKDGEDEKKDSNKTEAPTAEDVQRRQQRLGLGAKFLSHNQAQTLEKLAVEERLKKKLLGKKRKRGEGDGLEEEEEEEERSKKGAMKSGAGPKKQPGNEEESEDEDEGESRTKAIKKTSTPTSTNLDVFSLNSAKKKKKKKGKGKTGLEGFQAPATAQEKQDTEEDAGEVVKKEAAPKPAAETDALKASNQVEGTPEPAELAEGGAPAPFKRKKRTRSRQKNIRKDNRPVDKKPTYLSPTASDYIGDKRFGQRKAFSSKVQKKDAPADPADPPS